MKKILYSLSLVALVGAIVAGATYAIVAATARIDNNLIGVGSVITPPGLTVHALDTGEISKPFNVLDLSPGEWTPWARAGIQNTGEAPVRVSMHVENLQGMACDVTNLEVRTGYAGGNERERLVYEGSLTGALGFENRVEITGIPPFEEIPVNWTQIIHQRTQIHSGISSSYEGTTCQWDEVFTTEVDMENENNNVNNEV
jgi:hypothetical protein